MINIINLFVANLTTKKFSIDRLVKTILIQVLINNIINTEIVIHVYSIFKISIIFILTEPEK